MKPRGAARLHAAVRAARLPRPLGRIAMPRIDFALDRDFVELNQLLKLAGLVDSGGAGKQLVDSGAVRVDGAIESRRTCKIRAGQVVSLGDVEIHVRRPGA